MISFYSETDFNLINKAQLKHWISIVLEHYNYKEGDISYIFCDDNYLIDKNIKYLNHNTLTDIISFDYTKGKLISGDIFISIDRIKENAKEFNVSFNDELNRVMIHGILHFIGYNDKTQEEKELMHKEEDYCLTLRTF